MKHFGLVATVAAIWAAVDVGGLGRYDNRLWRELTSERSSDHLVQLDLMGHASALEAFMVPEEMDAVFHERGFRTRATREALDQRRHILRACAVLFGDEATAVSPVPPAREEILRAILAGLVDQARERSYNGWGEPVFDGRKIARESVVDPGPRIEDDWMDLDDPPPPPPEPMWVVGTPFNLETRRGGTMPLLRFVSEIDPRWVTPLPDQERAP